MLRALILFVIKLGVTEFDDIVHDVVRSVVEERRCRVYSSGNDGGGCEGKD